MEAEGPNDPWTYTGSQGGYTLGSGQGMKDGGYYSDLRAEQDREGETWRGILEVNDTYYDEEPKWGLDIDLYPPEMWPWK